MEYKPYVRRANYYETDRMGIVHHSNHIRYFEEARIQFLHNIGCDVKEVEKLGLIIPNVDAYAKCEKTIEFSDLLQVDVKLVKFNGVRMEFDYLITFAETGEAAAEGHTAHRFVNSEHKPVSVKHTFPEIYRKMKENVT
ncbi:MAG: acyl-CoA thioesterase [Clostridiales bacterium]|nr:acyl-CoA thioesterase [Clostridiales bacterium]